MKTIFAILSLAFLVAPAFAIADDTPAAAPAPAPVNAQLTPEQQQALSAAMQQARAQSKALLMQTRAQIINALSPAHRALYASVVGGLAIAPNPDPAAAARQLDTALSPAERDAILRSHASLMNQMRSMHAQMRSQLEASLPAGMPKHMGPPRGEGLGPNSAARPAPDAGRILLHLAGAAGIEPEFGHGSMMMGLPPRP